MLKPVLNLPKTAQNVDITVAALIESDGRYLLVEEHAGGRVVFNQPAGHLEPGESLTDAVIRETLEETGFRFEPTAVLGLYQWCSDAEELTFLRVAFCGLASAPIGKPVLDDVIIATHWLSRDQILARESRLRSPMVLSCIDDHAAGKQFPLSCLAELRLEQRFRQTGA